MRHYFVAHHALFCVSHGNLRIIDQRDVIITGIVLQLCETVQYCSSEFKYILTSLGRLYIKMKPDKTTGLLRKRQWNNAYCLHDLDVVTVKTSNQVYMKRDGTVWSVEPGRSEAEPALELAGVRVTGLARHRCAYAATMYDRTLMMTCGGQNFYTVGGFTTSVASPELLQTAVFDHTKQNLWIECNGHVYRKSINSVRLYDMGVQVKMFSAACLTDRGLFRKKTGTIITVPKDVLQQIEEIIVVANSVVVVLRSDSDLPVWRDTPEGPIYVNLSVITSYGHHTGFWFHYDRKVYRLGRIPEYNRVPFIKTTLNQVDVYMSDFETSQVEWIDQGCYMPKERMYYQRLTLRAIADLEEMVIDSQLKPTPQPKLKALSVILQKRHILDHLWSSFVNNPGRYSIEIKNEKNMSTGDGASRWAIYLASRQFQQQYLHGDFKDPERLGEMLAALYRNSDHLPFRLPIDLLSAILSTGSKSGPFEYCRTLEETEFLAEQWKPVEFQCVLDADEAKTGISYVDALDTILCVSADADQYQRYLQAAKSFCQYVSVKGISNLPTLDRFLSGPYNIDVEQLLDRLTLKGGKVNRAQFEAIKAMLKTCTQEELQAVLVNWTGCPVLMDCRYIVSISTAKTASDCDRDSDDEEEDTIGTIGIKYNTCGKTITVNASLIDNDLLKALITVKDEAMIR